MDQQDNLQELDFEAIMQEFHDPAKDAFSPVDESDKGSTPVTDTVNSDTVQGSPNVNSSLPESEEVEAERNVQTNQDTASEEATVNTSDTIRIENLDDISQQEDSSDPGEKTPSEEGAQQSVSPDTSNPAKQKAFPLFPREQLHTLKSKLIAGPEKRYYELEEMGVGKLQVAILLNILLALLCAGVAALYAAGYVPTNRMRLLTFSQILAMLISATLGSNLLLDGFGDIFHGKFTLNTLMAFTFLSCCGDGIFCLKSLRIPCCAAFCLEMTMAMWARYHKRIAEREQMDTLRKAVQLGSITKSAEYYNGFPGILKGQGDVDDFLDTYSKLSGPEKVQNIYAFVSLILCLGISTATGFFHSSDMAVQILSTSLLIAAPASYFVSITRPAALLERRLHMVGSVLCGWSGVEKLCGKAAVPIKDVDLFPSGSAKLNGVKFYGARSANEVVAVTSSLIQQTSSGLSNVFRTLQENRGVSKYSVEDFRDYGNGGIGGIVLDEPVLLGTLDFMQDMGVEIPEGTTVSQAVYAAIGGELCAVFAISYAKMRSSTAGLVSLLGCRRLTPIMLTRDFILTENYLGSKFSVKTKRMVFPDRDSRDALSAVSSDPEADVLALTTRQDLTSMVYCVTGSGALRTAARLGTAVHLLGGILGIVIMGAIAYLGATELLTPINIFLYQLVWMIPGLLITEWTRTV